MKKFFPINAEINCVYRLEIRKNILNFNIFLQSTLRSEVPYVIMYLSVHDSDRKRAFTLFNRLKKEKYVETYLKESSTGPSRKYYHITNEGRAAYNKMRQEWDDFSGVINMLLKGVDNNEQK